MKLKVKNASFSYDSKVDIIKNINFSLNQGEILSILGPNGVGKTTFIKNLIGLLNWHKGGTFIDDENIKNIKNIWQILSYVPQAKLSAFTFEVLEMVVLGVNSHLKSFQNPNKKDYQKAEFLLNELGIAKLKNKLFNQISGGEQQMVLIARALINEPKVLILDEPESNLDFKNQLIILNTIHNLSKNRQITAVFNTHYPEHALEISDFSLILFKDTNYLFGKSDDVINERSLNDAFGVKVAIKEVMINNKVKKIIKAYNE